MCLCVDWNIFVYWCIHVCSYLTRQGLGWLDASAGTVEHVPLDGFKLGWNMGETDEKCGVYSVYPQKTGIWLDLTYETGGINTYIYIYTYFVCFQQILGGHLKVTARAVMELLSCWFKIVGGWSWPKSLIPIEYSRVLPVFSDVRSSLQLFELSEVRFFLMFVTVKQTILDSTGCCPFTTRLSGRTC